MAVDFHGADWTWRDSRGTQVRGRSVAKYEIGNGKVLVFPQNRSPECADRVHRFGNQTEDQVDVVNHQVEHDSDIGAAPRVHSFAAGVDVVNRFAIYRLSGPGPSRIESLDVTDLQPAIVSLRAGDEIIGFANRASDWFFDKGVDPSIEAPATDRMMVNRRRRDHHGVDLVFQRFVRRSRWQYKLGLDFVSGFRRGIADGDEFDVLPGR